MNNIKEITEISNISDDENQIIYEAKGLNLWYGSSQALRGIDIQIPEHKITAIIGPSGCGKSTFIKTLNRMIDYVTTVTRKGEVLFKGSDIFSSKISVEELRAQVGMVFQKPNPFPKSIYENVVYGPKIHGIKNKKILMQIAEGSLKGAALWDEVKDRLNDNAYGLSGGQQQRLCIARTLAMSPEVILMDEPTSSLDPVATLKIEELLETLKKDYTVIIVTHNMQQAARISDQTAFFLSGELIEYDQTSKIFANPKDKRTEDYITGRFG